MLKQLDELRGLIAVDLVARINICERINRDRDRSDPNGIGEQPMKKLGRLNDACARPAFPLREWSPAREIAPSRPYRRSRRRAAGLPAHVRISLLFAGYPILVAR